MQVLIMGCGRVGAMISSALAAEGHTVYILDPEPENFERLPQDLLNSNKIIPIIGNGTQEFYLKKAKIEKADVFIALSSKDTQNAFAAQMAKHIFKVPKVVCRLNDPGRQEVYAQLGINVVSPTRFVADMLLEAIRR